MITRIWHGWTSQADAEAYERLLDTAIVPGIIERGIPGLHDVEILRRDTDDDEVEFVTVMTFDGWGAVEAFAGSASTTAVVPSVARRLLRRYDTVSLHYEQVSRHSTTA